MYYAHFGLTENPFRPTPDPRYLYLSRGHREALDHLSYGIGERKGFILVTGDVGTGKTTLLRSLLEGLDESVKTALVLNPFLSEEDLLPTIVDEFGIELPPGAGRKAQLDAINRFLLATHVSGGNAVLLLDEAQNLPRDVLEQVRILSNLETEREKLLQIVLVGQPELSQILSLESLRQLSDRIVVRYHLGPLDAEDSRSYVIHRMVRAGCRGRAPFARSAWSALYAESGGVPRRINAICDRALLAAYGKERHQVSARDIRAAARDVAGRPAEASRAGGGPWLRIAGAAALGAVLALAAVGTVKTLSAPQTPAVSVQAPAPAVSRAPMVSPPPLAPSAPARTEAARAVAAVPEEVPAPTTALTPDEGGEPSAGRVKNPFLPVLMVDGKEVDLAGPAMEAKAEPAPEASPLAGENRSEATLAGIFTLYAAQGPGSGDPSLFSFYTDLKRARVFKRPFRAALDCEDVAGDCYEILTPGPGGALLSEGREAEPDRLSGRWTGEVVWLIPRRLGAGRWGVGSSGPGVLWIQKTLMDAGYAMTADGIYGPRTAGAVSRFQKDMGLSPDGVVGFLTAGLLYQISETEPPREEAVADSRT